MGLTFVKPLISVPVLARLLTALAATVVLIMVLSTQMDDVNSTLKGVIACLFVYLILMSYYRTFKAYTVQLARSAGGSLSDRFANRLGPATLGRMHLNLNKS